MRLSLASGFSASFFFLTTVLALASVPACASADPPAQESAAELSSAVDAAAPGCAPGEGDPCNPCQDGQTCVQACGVDGKGGCEPHGAPFCSKPEHIYSHRVFGGYLVDSTCSPWNHPHANP
jgi:hypothetical protein